MKNKSTVIFLFKQFWFVIVYTYVDKPTTYMNIPIVCHFQHKVLFFQNASTEDHRIFTL